jgi:DNA-binding response OmpR family regulator
MSAKSIMVVDDELDIRDIVKATLEHENYIVTTSPDGETALRLADEHVFDLILLDIGMPGIDGIEVCRRLKHSETSQNVPVVFLTARNELSSKVSAFLSGGRRYISKPFEIDYLIDTVAAILNAQEQIADQ